MVIASYILAVTFAIGGGLALWGAVSNAEWLFRSPNSRALTGRMPRKAARVLYGLCGAAILAMAVAIIR